MTNIFDTGWALFLDDVRSPGDVHEDTEGWVVLRTSLEAIDFVREHGMPAVMSLDHDLGGDDTAMQFLKWMAYEFWTNEAVPSYMIHSANPVGCENIDSFMESWDRSTKL